VTIALDAGRGTLAAFVRAHVQSELNAVEVPINQSYVRLALPGFEALADAFPVR
jgi:hypothetical protein